MASVYVIEPSNPRFLADLSQDPLCQRVYVNRIEVHTTNRRWVICLAGKPQGEKELWEGLAAKIESINDQVDAVEFSWTEVQEEAPGNDDENYMDEVLRQFNGPEVPTAATPNTTDQKASGSGRRWGKKKLTQAIRGEPADIATINEVENNVILEGEVVVADSRPTRSGTVLYTFDLYDGTDSISCKLFADPEQALPVLTVGSRFRVKGNVQYQAYDGELTVMVSQLNSAPAAPTITDDMDAKRVEFHLHTKMSGMDGTIDTVQAVELAASWGHTAVAITDHGVIQAFPEAYQAGQKYGIKILYGVEGYLADGEKDRPYHIIILAKNKTGLKNLYRLISASHMQHFYRRPRIPRSLLQEHREGLILGSACEAGEVYQALLQGNGRAEEAAAFYDYLEIQPVGNNEFLIGTERVRTEADLQAFNQDIVALGKKLNKPVIATGDVHFLRPEDAIARTVLLAGQGFEDAEHQAPLFFRTTAEMLQEFSYLGAETARDVVITNPAAVAADIEHLTPVPEGLHPPEIPDADKVLTEMAYATAREMYGGKLPKTVAKRLQRELKAIIGNGYAPLYWIAHKLVKKSLDDGYLVGSRGSVGSSLVATFCGITEVNPLPPHYICQACHWSEFTSDTTIGAGADLPAKNCPECGGTATTAGFDIPFEVFMGFHGDKVPDIDLNFSGEYQAQVHRYTEELFGQDHVFRAGTIGTLADKTAYGFVRKWLEETGQQRRGAEVNRLLKKITGVRRTTGQHPGGMMVVPSNLDIHDFTPVQYPANDGSSGIVTTHFDYHAIHDSLVKLDILGHDDPTMLRMLEDLTGVDVLGISLNDPDTMSIFSSLDALQVTEEQIGTSVGTLGIPEFGTRFVRQMLVETKPTTFSELVRISGLSHGSNVWNGNAQELIAAGTADLAEVIACRDDIMIFLIQQGLKPSDAFQIMEKVRKGQGLKDKDLRLLKGHHVPSWYIESCQKISYMFPKAHAVAYVTMAFRIAYFKVHYPAAYYAAFFSVRAGDFDAHLVIQGEPTIRREMAAIEGKGSSATAKEKNVTTILEIVLEALARGTVFCPVNLYESDDRRFRVTERGLLPPLAALQGLGSNAAAAIATARMAGPFTSIEDLRQRAKVTKTVIEVLRSHGALDGMSETNQLTLF